MTLICGNTNSRVERNQFSDIRDVRDQIYFKAEIAVSLVSLDGFYLRVLAWPKFCCSLGRRNTKKFDPKLNF